MKKIIAVLSLFLLFGSLMCYPQEPDTIYPWKKTYTGSLDIKFNDPQITIKNDIQENQKFNELISKSLKNDSLFLEEMKTTSKDVTSTLQNLLLPNRVLLESYDLEVAMSIISKEGLIKTWSKVGAILSMLLLLFISIAITDKIAVNVSDRAKIEHFIYVFLLTATTYYLLYFFGNLIFNSEIFTIKQILNYKI